MAETPRQKSRQTFLFFLFLSGGKQIRKEGKDRTKVCFLFRVWGISF